MFSRMIKDHENVGDLVRLSFSLIIVPAFITAAAAFTYALPVMSLLYHEHAAESAGILGMLMTCFIFLSSSYIFGTLLTAGGKLRYLNITALCGMLMNVVLNLLLIPWLGIKGAAISCLCTQSATAIAQVFISRHVYRLNTDCSLLLRLLVYVLTVAASFAIFYDPGQGWKLSLMLSSIVSVALAFMLRVIRWKDLGLLRLNAPAV